MPLFGCKVYGDVWVHVYAFWVHVYGSVGCMSMDRLGACMRLLGASLRLRLGAKYAEVGCKFHTADSLPDSR